MKKVILMTLALLLIISCAGLIACGSSGSAESTTAAAKTTVGLAATAKTISQTTTTTVSSGGGGGTWMDVPLYPGAKMLIEQSFNSPNEKYTKEIHRVYETTDSVSKVAAFYKSGMPASGWTEMFWTETSVIVTAQYNKNNEKDFASVTAGSSNSKTSINLVRDY